MAVSPAAAATASTAIGSDGAGGVKAAPGAEGGSNSSSSTFALGALQQLKVELKGCGDVGKLLEGAALLAQLACVTDCSASAMQTVMVMLVNRYPKVRAQHKPVLWWGRQCTTQQAGPMLFMVATQRCR